LIGEFVDASALQCRHHKGWSIVPALSAALVAYLAMYAATARLTRIVCVETFLTTQGHAPQARRVPAPGC
jgi:hypothetical protein